MFELTILLTAFATIFGMLVLNFLPRYHHPVFNWSAFEKVTDNSFYLVIEAVDPLFSSEATAYFLEKVGGYNVTPIHHES